MKHIYKTYKKQKKKDKVKDDISKFEKKLKYLLIRVQITLLGQS